MGLKDIDRKINDHILSYNERVEEINKLNQQLNRTVFWSCFIMGFIASFTWKLAKAYKKAGL